MDREWRGIGRSEVVEMFAPATISAMLSKARKNKAVILGEVVPCSTRNNASGKSATTIQ